MRVSSSSHDTNKNGLLMQAVFIGSELTSGTETG